MWLSIVLPAHNEAENIGPVVEDFLEAGEETGRPFEVIVVDDASTDGTARLAERAEGASSERVRVIRRKEQGGYGGALITGFEQSRGEWVFFSDADGQFSGDELPELIETLQESGADIAAGYRQSRQDLWHRRSLGQLWSSLVRGLFQVDVQDVNCAYKIIRRRNLERMNLRSRGAMINAELLHKARRLGLDIVERPVRHHQRDAGESSGARPAVIGRALIEMTRYRLQTLGGRD